VSKTLGSIALVAAAVAVNVIPGAGQFISASLVAIGLSKAAALAITTAIASTATVAGLASAASLLGLGPGGIKPETTQASIKTSRPPRVSGTGKSRLWGAFALYETASDGTAVDLYAVHDGVITGTPTFYLADEEVTLTGNIVDEGDDGRYRDGAISIYWTDGTTPGSGIPEINALIPEWDGRGDGVVLMALTALSVKVKRFQETYPQAAVPELSMVAEWGLYPDPSAVDPTDEAGWTWTENPVRHLLWYKLIHEGVDYATKIAPVIDSWIAAAYDCDAATALKAGGTEARYRSCVAFKHTDQHKDVVGAFLATFDGWISPRQDGALSLYSGRFYEPTVSIGSDEIVSYTWDGVGIDDDAAVNEIIVSYVSAEHDYNSPEGEAWRDEDDISDRGQELSQPLDVQVPSFPQARRLAKRKMARIMAPSRGTITTNVAGRAVRGERYIDLHIEEAGTVFYSGPAEITVLTRNIATGGVTFAWVAADPDIDDWNPATEEGEPAALGERVAAATLTAPTITAVVAIEGPRLQLTVSGPDREDLTWFGHTRVSGATIWGTDLEYTEVASGTTVTLVTDIIPPDATVEVQVAYQVGDGRISAWSTTASGNSSLAPYYMASGTAVSGSGDVSPALPAGLSADDILILLVETANQPVAAPAGYSQVTNSPQGVGVAGAATATALQMFWKRATGSESAPTVTGTTDHKVARLLAIRNCIAAGDPYEASVGDTLATASATVTVPGLTTLGARRLVLAASSRANDDASQAAFSNWLNGSLSSVTRRAEGGTTTGNGGGFGTATGVKDVAGATGVTTATISASAEQARIAIALKPAA